METTTIADLGPATLFCSGQGEDYGYCAPVSTTAYDSSATRLFISISTTIITTTETASGMSPPNIPYPAATLWIRPQKKMETTRTLLIIIPIVGGLLLIGIVIGVWRWRFLRKTRGYPGWRVMSMLGRSRGNGKLGGDGVRTGEGVRAGGGVRTGGVDETEMAARSSREELERITNSTGNVRAAPVAVASIDAVVASDNVQAGKQGGDMVKDA